MGAGPRGGGTAGLRFLGAAGTVTGSKYLLEVARSRVLVDCGLFQGLKELRQRNWARFPVAPDAIHAVVLTHAHIDHSGYLPRLAKEGFRGPIYATPATGALLRILLPDSGHLQEEEAAYANRKRFTRHRPALPLYTREEAEKVLAQIRPMPYDDWTAVAEGVRVRPCRAGHILGSAILEVGLGSGRGERTVVFSGDLGRYGAPLLPDPTPVPEADYLLVESTYGDRRYPEDPVEDRLAAAIQRAVGRGGVMLIPAFAVGRTQEVMYHLWRLEAAGRIPQLPVYVDSPMARDATDLYYEFPDELDRHGLAALRAGRGALQSHDFHLVDSVEGSKALNGMAGPAIIISASGMVTGGRILHHMRLRLPDPRNTILFVGFQAMGTRGRAIQEGAEAVKIHGEWVPVRAQVETMDGLSAHADADGIQQWLHGFRKPPRRTFIVHGEPQPARALQAAIATRRRWDVRVPAHGERAAFL
jgi:metallo-beta-lactamase family protein